MLVLSMGLILIGGTVMLAGMVWKKVNAEVTGTGAYACNGGNVDLSGHGLVSGMERDGKNMIVTLQKDAQTVDVATVDMCAAKVKSVVSLRVDGHKK